MAKFTRMAAVIAAALAGPAIAFAADPVTPDQLLKADQDPGNWLTHHKDYSAQRFSPLNQINKDNVKNLHVAWTLQLGRRGGRRDLGARRTGGHSDRSGRHDVRHRRLGVGV